MEQEVTVIVTVQQGFVQKREKEVNVPKRAGLWNIQTEYYIKACTGSKLLRILLRKM